MRITVLAIAVWLVSHAPLLAQDTEAWAIVEKAINAQGDKKAAAKLVAGTVKAKGTLHLMDMTFDLTVQAWFQLPDKSKESITVTGNGAKIEIVEAITGDKGWTSFNGTVSDLDDDELKEAKEMMHVDRVTELIGLHGDKEIKLTSLTPANAGDRATVGVKVTKKGRRDVSLYFDKQTNLLIKAEYQAFDPFTEAEVTQEKLFIGYKEYVPGFKSASKITVKNDGQPYMELEIIDIRPVDQHVIGTFTRPD
jgi:hypothetical protein